MRSERTRIERMVIVNFGRVEMFEIEYDRLLTLVEGDNGIGKSTILLSSFICHMPDKNTFAFRNQQGEKTGMAELTGRLPESGSVWVAFQAVNSKWERLLYGVMMTKTGLNKADIVTFFVEDFRFEDDLADIFVRKDEIVRNMPEVVEYLQIKGMALRKPQKLTEYLQKLTDFGVHSGDMANEKRRRDYAEVILSCMYGGISKDIGQRIREFLLPEMPEIGRQKVESQQALVECQKILQDIKEFEDAHRRVSEFSTTGERMLLYSVAGMWRLVKNIVWGPTGVITLKREEQKLVKELQAANERKQALESEVGEAETAVVDADKASRGAEEHLRLTKEAFQLKEELKDLQKKEDQEKTAVVGDKSVYDAAKARFEAAKHASDEADKARDEAADAATNADIGVKALLERKSRYRAAVSLAGKLVENQKDIPASKDEAIGMAKEGDQIAEELRAAARDCKQMLENAEDIRKSHEKAQAVFMSAFRFPSIEDPVVALQALDRVLIVRSAAAKKRESVLGAIRTLNDLRTKQGRVIKALTDAEIPCTTAETFYSWLEQAQNDNTSLERQITQLENDVKACKADRDRVQEQLGKYEEKKRLLGVWTERRKELESKSRKIESMSDGRALVKELHNGNIALDNELSALESEQENLRKVNQSLASACVAPWLSEICEGIPEARLVADYLDDVPIGDSARIEAALGPLSRGIVVGDPVTSADDMAAREIPETLWFANKETVSSLSTITGGNGNNVVVHAEGGSRVSPLPEAPVIGREAREREREKNEKRIRDIDQRIVAIMQEQEGQSKLITNLEELLDDPIAFAESPIAQIEHCRLRIGKISEQMQLLTDEKVRAVGRQAKLSSQISQANAVAADASVLDETELDRRLLFAEARLSVYSRHVVWQEKVAPIAQGEFDQRTRLLLSQKVLSEAELFAKRAELQALNQQIVSVEAWREAAYGLSEIFPALADTQAEHEAQEAEQRFALLGEALTKARDAATEAKEKKEALEGALASVKAKLEVAEREHAQAETWVAAKKEEISKHKIGTATEEDIKAAEEIHSQATNKHGEAVRKRDALRDDLRNLNRDISDFDRNRGLAALNFSKRNDELKNVNDAYRPMKRALLDAGWKEIWKAVAHATTEDGSRDPELLLVAASVTAGRILALMDNLQAKVPRDSRLYEEFTALSQNPTSRTKGRRWVVAYQQLIQWLSSFYPPSILGAENPADALAKIDIYIPRLREKYETSQQRLRQTAQKVTQEIRRAMRTEKKRIRDMTDRLEKLAFGSISGITLQVQDNPDLLRFLDAMETQLDLFGGDTSLSIDEVLEETYRRVARGNFSASALLDYRNYLTVEVKMRRTLTGSWEKISGSTGESIGVGTAIFIVIFDAWEEDGRKRRKDWHPMRYLLIDEASRLSEATLKAIMDLAADLDVNILAACPDAPFMGRATAHHLELDESDPAGKRLVISGRFLRNKEAA